MELKGIEPSESKETEVTYRLCHLMVDQVQAVISHYTAPSQVLCTGKGHLGVAFLGTQHWEVVESNAGVCPLRRGWLL